MKNRELFVRELENREKLVVCMGCGKQNCGTAHTAKTKEA